MTAAPPTDAQQQQPPRAATPRRPFDASQLLACLIPGVAAWLLSGGLALAYDKVGAEGLAGVLIGMCMIGQLFSAIFTILSVEDGWPGRSMQVFAAGAAGLGITMAATVVLSPSLGAISFFLGTSGLYLGWLVEALATPMGRLTGYMNGRVPARRGEEGGAIGLQTVNQGYDLVDANSPRNSMEERRGSGEVRPAQGV